MKKTLLAFLIGAFTATALAQETDTTSNWDHKGTVGINFSQSSFTNWAAGGQNALNWIGTMNYKIDYAVDNFKWDNTFNASLGYSYFNFNMKPIKTDDKIELTSLAGLKASEKLYYSLELAFRSQFANGYNYETDSTHFTSKFLSPGYITLGLGVEWTPNKYFSVNFAPLTNRITIVNDPFLADRGAYGVEPGYFSPSDSTVWIPGKHIRYEFGARIAAKLEVPIAKNVDFNSKLELFSDYLNHPERVDVDWQNLLILKVNSWLNCTLSTHLIYDYDTDFFDATGAVINGSKVQFKEVLSIGIMYNLR